ncbi:hypothetical protein BDV93DRAFT_524043 [Ceratobasidium sp. AG-I]|nr:hypothetical protein BDV93DRAFT_524043 [Ceratobasidium sp. AG-I]
MLSLPPELCALIVIQVEIKDLAHLARTSHAMLDRFVPYLWQDVKAAWLLQLLRGALFEQEHRYGPYTKGRIQIPIPLPTNYFDRFIFYAQHVKRISMKMHLDYNESDISQHNLAWPSVLSFTSAYTLFPNVAKLRLEIREERSRMPWDWATLFIAPTLTDFRYCIPNRANRETSHMLDSITSKCLALQGTTFLGHGDICDWDCLVNSAASQSLRYLKVLRGTMGDSFLRWAGRMPELEVLDLQPYVWKDLGEATLVNFESLPDLFPNLLFLKFTYGNLL